VVCGGVGLTALLGGLTMYGPLRRFLLQLRSEEAAAIARGVADELQEDVSERLQQAMRADTQRTGTRLNMRKNLSLDPLEIGEGSHKNRKNNCDFDQTDDKEIHFFSLAVSSCTLPSRTPVLPCGSRYSSPGDSMTAFSFSENRPKVPEVNRVFCAPRVNSG